MKELDTNLNILEVKVCFRCNIEKNHNCFSKSLKHGLQLYCKSCNKHYHDFKNAEYKIKKLVLRIEKLQRKLNTFYQNVKSYKRTLSIKIYKKIVKRIELQQYALKKKIDILKEMLKED